MPYAKAYAETIITGFPQYEAQLSVRKDAFVAAISVVAAHLGENEHIACTIIQGVAHQASAMAGMAIGAEIGKRTLLSALSGKMSPNESAELVRKEMCTQENVYRLATAAMTAVRAFLDTTPLNEDSKDAVEMFFEAATDPLYVQAVQTAMLKHTPPLDVEGVLGGRSKVALKLIKN